MDVRLIGAVATVGAGLCALVFLGVVLLAPTSTRVDAPSDVLLVVRSDGSDDLTPWANLVPKGDMAVYGTPGDTRVDILTAPSSGARASASIAAPATPKAPPVSTFEPSAVRGPPAISREAPVSATKPAPSRAPDHKYDRVFTMDEIKRLKTAMRLSPDQEHFWGPVAGLLRDIGRQQIAKIDAGQKPEFDMGFDMMQRFYSAASPLLETLRDDQKAEIRRRATKMGLGAYASYI